MSSNRALNPNAWNLGFLALLETIWAGSLPQRLETVRRHIRAGKAFFKDFRGAGLDSLPDRYLTAGGLMTQHDRFKRRGKRFDIFTDTRHISEHYAVRDVYNVGLYIVRVKLPRD